MDTVEYIREQLNRMALAATDISVLQDRNGIAVARIRCAGDSYVIKCFQKEEYRREMENYRLLTELGIPTIRVHAATDSALLLEDIACSTFWRLGTEEDLSDPEVARKLACWYKQLHRKGLQYVQWHGDAMYDESDYFTRENISMLMQRSGTEHASAWELLLENFDAICCALSRVPKTLNYNDFYYVNFIVAKDKSAALMFDYNLLGKGYACNDVMNVLFSLSDAAGAAFLDAYGSVDPLERAIHSVVAPIVTLYLAYQYDELPWWAEGELNKIQTCYDRDIRHLLELI